MGGWKGTTDTHELIEQTHKRYLAGKGTTDDHQYDATTVTAAATAKRQVKQAME